MDQIRITPEVEPVFQVESRLIAVDPDQPMVGYVGGSEDHRETLGPEVGEDLLEDLDDFRHAPLLDVEDRYFGSRAVIDQSVFVSSECHGSASQSGCHSRAGVVATTGGAVSRIAAGVEPHLR